MPRIQLRGGAYTDASLIAAAQRCVNLYPERNPPGAQSPVEVTYYPRPGRTLLSSPPAPGNGRCLYVARGTGDLYAVVNQDTFYIDPNWIWHHVGRLQIAKTTPVYMADNGLDAIQVDGSPFGNIIHLANRVQTAIADPNFLGADRVDFLNYFLIFNQPKTPNWYSTEENSTVFNGLMIGTKTASPDNCTAVIATELTAWLFGPFKGEVWADAGTVPFAFQTVSGVIIDHGLAGSYALARQDVNVYWLSQSPEGGRMAMRGSGTSATRISNHAVEKEWLGYPRVDDCIVQTFQLRGHAFVSYHFPTADRTWVYDEAMPEEWHEEAAHDLNGVQHRMIDTFQAYAYGKNVSLDWRNGQLYQVDDTNFTDNGVANVYIRGMPHMLDQEFDRQTLWRVIADMGCGAGTGTTISQSPWSMGFNGGFGPNSVLVESQAVTLYISHDRGVSFFAHSDQPMGSQGQYNTRPTFNRCGTGFDFVLELRWAGPLKTALNGIFVTVEPHQGDA